LAAVREQPEVERLIVTSSQFVFNKGTRLPLGENDYHPITVYGQSKVVTDG